MGRVRRSKTGRGQDVQTITFIADSENNWYGQGGNGDEFPKLRNILCDSPNGENNTQVKQTFSNVGSRSAFAEKTEKSRRMGSPMCPPAF